MKKVIEAAIDAGMSPKQLRGVMEKTAERFNTIRKVTGQDWESLFNEDRGLYEIWPVGQAYAQGFGRIGSVTNRTEQKEVADLIAAAPRMYRALAAIRAGWQSNLTEPMKLVNEALLCVEAGQEAA